MFGYVRPLKGELKVREFARYRSLYCGICKSISRRYGQLPRFATSYDMTFLALLLSALRAEDPGIEAENCILHPARKDPTAQPSEILDYAAGASVLLMRYKFRDDLADKEKQVKAASLNLLFSSAAKKAAGDYPELDALFVRQLEQQEKAEAVFFRQPSLEDITAPFASLLGGLLEHAPKDDALESEYREGLVYAGRKLGQWVYLIDALDDLEKDAEKGRFNPLSGEGGPARRAEALRILEEAEDQIDAVFSLLPFYRDASILSNIIQLGLPDVRHKVEKGQTLRPL